jgi:hypothetical protein
VGVAIRRIANVEDLDKVIEFYVDALGSHLFRRLFDGN